MSYTVKSSEKLRKSSAEVETKALLFLMNFRNDSNDIYYFVIDFFNDLTGMDNMATRLWDLQSKGEHNVGPKVIGRELITLFKNYMSELSFEAYILFMSSVSGAFRIDPALTVFGIENVKDTAIKLMEIGLIEEGKKKSYINDADLTETNIEDFFKSVVFVLDDDKEPREYVRAIIKQHPNIIPEDKVLDAIFNEIRDKQSSKKNISVVEGVVIETTDEALNYCRHLTNNEIRMMTLQRIISRDPLNHGIPVSFVPIYASWPPEIQREMLEDCQGSLCRALFNRNAADGFWSLFEHTYQLIVDYPEETVQQLFGRLHALPNCVSCCPDFDVISLKYFISLVKDGIQQ